MNLGLGPPGPYPFWGCSSPWVGVTRGPRKYKGGGGWGKGWLGGSASFAKPPHGRKQGTKTTSKTQPPTKEKREKGEGVMNLTSSHPFWSVNNGLPANYPSLQRNVSCDAVVIGGGITGALVAVHLADAGVKTLVLDKRDIGTGSTSASTALLQYEIDVPLRELIKKVGPVDATRSYRLCRAAVGKLEQLAARLKIECGFERKPSLFLARHQREIPEFREEFQLRRKMGIELEFYDATAVRARFPVLTPRRALFQSRWPGGSAPPDPRPPGRGEARRS